MKVLVRKIWIAKPVITVSAVENEKKIFPNFQDAQSEKEDSELQALTSLPESAVLQEINSEGSGEDFGEIGSVFTEIGRAHV